MTTRLKDTLLLVGDRSSDRANLRETFESSFNLLEAESAAQAKLLLAQNINCIAAVLADLSLSAEDEIRELAKACNPEPSQAVPFLLLISSTGSGVREELAFGLGAIDVVYKPYTPSGVQRRLQIIIDLYLHRWNLEKLVMEQGEAIRNSNQVMLDALSAIIEHRSTESGNHVLRIRRFTKILLEAVAKVCPEYHLSDRVIDTIASASALHDIGKISIPDKILNKPGKLTDEEFEIIKSHTSVGGELVQNLSGMGDVEFLRYAYNIALYHHERWDGSGYPIGLAGDDIPICAQVVGIADAFDALTTRRAYKPAFSHERAINMILNGECGVFSPKLLECFKHVRDQFVKLAHLYADGYSPKSDQITAPLPGPVWHRPRLDSLQLSQIKYQTMLHYSNDTVIEFDLDNRLYHVVYNPNPDFEYLFFNASFDQINDRLLHDSIHPDDRNAAADLLRYFTQDIFNSDLRKKAISLRIYSPARVEYVPYEITLLRVNTQVTDQRICMMIFHRASGVETTAAARMSPPTSSLHSSPALYGLVSSALRCRIDPSMTIDAGTGDLYPLTGYTAEELEQDFGGRYLDLVFPEDRPAFCEAIQAIKNVGGTCETEYRLLRKDGTTLWVLDKSRSYLDADGREYVYHAVRDNSRVKAAIHRLQATNERNQVIIDQSDGIVFEWDLIGDVMHLSPKWEKTFGYKAISENYGAQMGIATHFHPDDLSTVRSAIGQLRQHGGSLVIDVRIADINAKYLWTKIVATAFSDENGVLSRIIGIIQNNDALKRAELALKEQAERDSLTRLLNKASAQNLIEDYLSVRDEGSLSALLILDLDNFKLINDNFGHMYGDAVLSQVGSNLKKMFRSHDIIGRIGGDEFLILMCDIPDAELVQNRCEQLLVSFRTLMGQYAPELPVSCSIGVALIPDHAANYSDAFRHADDALYRSKSLGKNTYSFYDAKTLPSSRMGGRRIITRIDSEDMPGMADASLVHFIFQRLYESDDILGTIDELLAFIGSQFNVSRVYIFENCEDNTACSNTFEWCNDGISPEIQNLQNISYITDIPGWPQVYNEEGIFYCADITALPPQFRAILEPQGIKSMLQCSIVDQGVFRGYVGFDECVVNRLWTQEQIDLLLFLAQVLTLFLLKERTRQNALTQTENLRSLLNSQDNWIYVIDPNTCKLKFLNTKFRNFAPGSNVGSTCYEVFMGRGSRCETCPALNIHELKNNSAILHNPNVGGPIRSQATEISWNGEPACLVVCHEAESECPPCRCPNQ